MTAEVCGQGQEASARCLEAVDVCYTVKADGEQVDFLVRDRQELGGCDRWRDLTDGRMVEAGHFQQPETVRLVVAAALLFYTLNLSASEGYRNTTHGLHADHEWERRPTHPKLLKGRPCGCVLFSGLP